MQLDLLNLIDSFVMLTMKTEKHHLLFIKNSKNSSCVIDIVGDLTSSIKFCGVIEQSSRSLSLQSNVTHSFLCPA